MKVPPKVTINVEVRRSSENGNWFAKMGENAQGEKAMVFFQRPGKPSLLQKLKDGLSGIQSGRQAANMYLQDFRPMGDKILDLDAHILALEKKAGGSHSISQTTEFKNKMDNVEIKKTTKLTFQNTPAMMMMQRLNGAIDQLKAINEKEKIGLLLGDFEKIPTEVSNAFNSKAGFNTIIEAQTKILNAVNRLEQSYVYSQLKPEVKIAFSEIIQTLRSAYDALSEPR